MEPMPLFPVDHVNVDPDKGSTRVKPQFGCTKIFFIYYERKIRSKLKVRHGFGPKSLI